MSQENNRYRAITANRLRDGAVVYRVALVNGDTWSTDVGDAAVYGKDELDIAFDAAHGDVADNVVVDPYAIDLDERDGVRGARELIRAAGGPTIAYGVEASAIQRSGNAARPSSAKTHVPL